MGFKNWLLVENKLVSYEGITIRDALPQEIPKLFIHRTEKFTDIESISKRGFNLRKFGHTARKHGSPDHLWKYDPRGIYALEYEEGHETYGDRPYVIFSADIKKALICDGSDKIMGCKELLFNHLAVNSSTELRNKLLKMGYQAFLRPRSEQIILDPKIIKIIKWGLPEMKSQ